MRVKTMAKATTLGVCVVLAATAASGCASGTETKRAEARGAAGSFRTSLAEMPETIDQAMSKLMTLADARTTNKAGALADFRKELTRMDSQARILGDESERAKRNADSYFRQWGRESALNGRADEAESMAAAKRANYGTAQSYLDSARRHYLDFTENLHSLADMYAGGSDSSQPLVSAALDKAGQDATYVKSYIARLEEQIDRLLGAR